MRGETSQWLETGRDIKALNESEVCRSMLTCSQTRGLDCFNKWPYTYRHFPEIFFRVSINHN